MIDPRREAVLIRRRDQSGVEDKTPEVLEYRVDGDAVHITFRSAGGPRTYRYSARNVTVLRDPVSTSIDDRTCISLRGRAVHGVTDLLCFRGPAGAWWRAFFPDSDGESYRTCREEEISIERSPAPGTEASEVLNYWHNVVSHLSQDDPLRRPYANFRTIPQESVLDLYLRGHSPDPEPELDEYIFPFSSNLSQREALRMGLAHRISVIDGPPGTGKTQTILNLVANIIRSPGKSVAIVSSNNAAVENVRDKLAKEGFGHVVADLRRNDLKREFFEKKHVGNMDIQRRAGASPVAAPEAGTISSLDGQLQQLQFTARELAKKRQELDAFRLEQRHFSRHIAHHDPAPLPALTLLQGPSSRILEFLAEAACIPADERPLRRLFRRIRSRFRYGSTRDLDSGDTDVVMRLQAAYYAARIAELEKQIEQAAAHLAGNDFPALEDELRQLSQQSLKAGLYQRYAGLRPQSYTDGSYLRQFAAFTTGYPVVLSTCHSLRRSVPSGYLFDYLIIDEASQVDLLAAGLALSCARKVIVVGDLRQLQHIAVQEAARRAGPAPAPSYDYGRQNILSSIIERFGAAVPRTMLREHYRCDPAIIEFCNRKFYGGQLIPYTEGDPERSALAVVRTAPGNHMRQHLGGGRTNHREADVIAKDVLERFCSGTRHEDIGVVTPYRRQVDKVAEALLNSIQADTVHKFQGREKEVIIMSTVLDETRDGNSGVDFVDNPQMVNVAVSRAIKQFVLVTNHEMMPASRHLRDLVEFIRYHNPDDGISDSGVVSVFDLLYREYSAVLQPLAERMQTPSAFASENIIWTVLLEILAEELFKDLAVAREVHIRNLLPGLSRLTTAQAAYVRNGARFDFLVYSRITNRPFLAVEVDGFAFHENDGRQQARDSLKDEICRAHGIRLLRLPTTGSGEPHLIRQELRAATGPKALC
ncbi:hypothetical protein CXX84_16455 [Arthrobacter sp. AFG7.2]|uniref:AAA domain-containing protein n=1 Tax=Arthrobacter sp. AFG7.2 TaxID=1688693 RepID=UPI000C9DDAE4|nr:AAA domain-containing protein [Arthrobacter sp. AFG7.2]PNI07420.1 hypothetical protein CXX84_16455 [Arthrobacter sp. AFG7.2]